MDVAKIAGIITGTALVIGILYNVAYFTALDLQLFPLLSYKDHLETLIYFVPIAIFGLLLCAWLRKQPARQQTANRVALVVGGVTVLYWLGRDQLVGFPTVSAILTSLVFFLAILLLANCVSTIIGNLLDLGAGADSAHWLVITVTGICALVIVALFGNVRGHLDAAASRFDIKITLTGESGAQPEIRTARIVRTIDSGLLLVFQDAPGQLAYVRNESIRMIAEPLHP